MDWSSLPSELLAAIAGNLSEFTDHLRFGSVCSHWRSCSRSLRLPRPLPWLTLASPSPSPSTHLYSLSEDRVYSNLFPGVSDKHNACLFGSPSGWFLSIGGRNPCITTSLVNPFTGASVGLPSPPDTASSPFSTRFAECHIWDRSDSVVMVACSMRKGVFYCRLAEPDWSRLESHMNSTASSITFCEGRFYILEANTYETAILDGETLQLLTVVEPPDVDSPLSAHLSVSSNQLFFFVKRPCINQFSQTYELHRANLSDEMAMVEWVEISDIGDCALLVDNLHCLSVQVGDGDHLRRNCVYIAKWGIIRPSKKRLRTDSNSMNQPRTYTISIFDLENRNVRRLKGALCNFCGAHPHVTASPPSWVLPALN